MVLFFYLPKDFISSLPILAFVSVFIIYPACFIGRVDITGTYAVSLALQAEYFRQLLKPVT